MNAIGIDISDVTIEIAEMRQRFGSVNLRSIARTRLPQGIVDKGVIIDQEALVKHLQECAAKAKPSPIKISAAHFDIPESKVFTHVFSFPRELKKNDVEDAIKIQFSEYFPYDIEETAIDWKVVQESDQTQMILVGACEMKYIEQLVELGKKAGIRISGIDIESISNARAIMPVPKDVEAYMMVDAGANVTSISIFDSSGLQTTFALDSGGEKLTQQIAKLRDISHDQAEELKKKLDLKDIAVTDKSDKTKAANGVKTQVAENEDVYKLVTDQLHPVIEEMKRTMAFYEGSRRKTIKAVYLCGGMSLMNGFDVYIKKMLSLPVNIGDPLTHIKHSNLLTKEDNVLLYANVIGLTIGSLDRRYHNSRFNFLQSYQEKKEKN